MLLYGPASWPYGNLVNALCKIPYCTCLSHPLARLLRKREDILELDKLVSNFYRTSNDVKYLATG